MRPHDVRECVEIVAAHPIVGPRYGSAIADLGPVWLRLLACNGLASAVVFEEADQAGCKIIGVGITAFLSDNFLRELKTPPFFWMGPELARRVARGDHSSLLSLRQIQVANSQEGLNLAVWHASIRNEDVNRVEVWTELMTAFLSEHVGFLLKELVSQGESPQHLEGIRNTGGFLLKSQDVGYGDFDGTDLHELVLQPHIVGLTREMALQQLGSWIGTLFQYEPPQFGFSRSEQRLLLSALPGGTDEQLSAELGVSLSTIKKTWRSAYDRVAACFPELIPSNSPSNSKTSARGRDKKQHLISYLRAHPQELRPVSRKLLRQNGSPGHRFAEHRPAS